MVGLICGIFAYLLVALLVVIGVGLRVQGKEDRHLPLVEQKRTARWVWLAPVWPLAVFVIPLGIIYMFIELFWDVAAFTLGKRETFSGE